MERACYRGSYCSPGRCRVGKDCDRGDSLWVTIDPQHECSKVTGLRRYWARGPTASHPTLALPSRGLLSQHHRRSRKSGCHDATKIGLFIGTINNKAVSSAGQWDGVVAVQAGGTSSTFTFGSYSRT